MAYAQLAGLPPYYGLYASLLPPVVGSLFGSSRQLATGPVAIVSLMTSAALAPLAVSGSEAYIAYALTLAVLVGLFQFLLGVLRLGILVNFLSHPVVNGFTNAAAIVIATSQLSKLFGVEVETSNHHYETVLNVISQALRSIHWPTFWLACLAFAIMILLRWINTRLPFVLVAVVLTTFGSWAIGFEKRRSVPLSAIGDPGLVKTVQEYNAALEEIDQITQRRVELTDEIQGLEARFGRKDYSTIEANSELVKLLVSCETLTSQASVFRTRLREYTYIAVEGTDASVRFFPPDQIPADAVLLEGEWRLRVSYQKIDRDAVNMTGGGAVVGAIPRGLPRFSVPRFDFSSVTKLLAMAMVISMLGFMEAISIAKRMATATGQRIDPNQELIGQGLANLGGAFFGSYPVSGSFSRSALNLQAGATTGLSMVFSSILVLVTLLAFTPLLYHLPLSVLASIIMMAVVGLVNVRGFIHAWKAQKIDGAISVITFLCTLAFAPHLETGIIIGVCLSTGAFLVRTMKPNWAILSRSPDGIYRDANRFDLEMCRHVAVVAFNCSLIFANVDQLEEILQRLVGSMPDLKHLLLVGYGINELDASGEVLLSVFTSRLRLEGKDISFVGMNEHVLAVMRRTGLEEKVGRDHFYPNIAEAVARIAKGSCIQSRGHSCPLISPETGRYDLEQVPAAGRPRQIGMD
jgi:MFS superfamily sulfate permease-like transporter